MKSRTPLQCQGVGGAPRSAGLTRSDITREVMLAAVKTDRNLPSPPADFSTGLEDVWGVVFPNNKEVGTVLVPRAYDHPTPTVEAEIFDDDVALGHRSKPHTVPIKVHCASCGRVVHLAKVVLRHRR